MSTSSDSSAEVRKIRVPKHPKTATEWFVFLSHESFGSGALPASRGTFCPAVVRTPTHWPALLAKRDPSVQDIENPDGEPGSLIRGFSTVAEIAFSTGVRGAVPVINGWQKDRLREYTQLFQNIASAYVHYSVDANLSTRDNCCNFLQSINGTLLAAIAKRDQLLIDYIYKVKGPRAARAVRDGLTLSVAEWPEELRGIMRSATRASPFFNNRRRDEGESEGQARRGGFTGRGSFSSRGRGNFRGGRRGNETNTESARGGRGARTEETGPAQQ